MANRGLEKLYADVRDSHLQPLWVETAEYVPPAPSPKVMAAHWPAATVFPLLREAGRHVSADLADRRVLICKNPGLPPFSGTTQTLYACVQLLLPGERTSEHRHTQSAFRLVLSGEGAVTLLNGSRVRMRPGDLIATPPWTWHGHVNDSDNEVIWLDGLDNGIVRLFDATFFERLPQEKAPVEISEEVATHSSNRVARKHFDNLTMRRQLDALRRSGPPDPIHGYRLRYLDPATGTDVLPTMAAHLTGLPQGFRTEVYRSSDSVVFVVVEGEGVTECPSESIRWSRHDIFTVPSWEAHEHEVSRDAILFSFSDRGAQERLGCWREQVGS